METLQKKYFRAALTHTALLNQPGLRLFNILFQLSDHALISTSVCISVLSIDFTDLLIVFMESFSFVANGERGIIFFQLNLL